MKMKKANGYAAGFLALLIGLSLPSLARAIDSEGSPPPVVEDAPLKVPSALSPSETTPEENPERGIIGVIYPAAAQVGNSFLSGADHLDNEIRSLLPLGKSIAGDRVDELPLPVGIAFGYNHQWDKMEASNLFVKLGRRPERAISSDLISDIKASTNTYTMNVDMWVLPFWNIFGILAYSEGQAEIKLNVPDLLPSSLEVPYSVLSYGGGTNLTIGWRQIFVVANATFTQQQVNLFEDKVNVLILAPRIGWQEDFGPTAVSVWTGANYLDLSKEREGSLILPGPMQRELAFRLDVQPVANWNAALGARVSIGKRFDFLLDAGVGVRKSILFSTAFRF
jgi:hypothetical protein